MDNDNKNILFIYSGIHLHPTVKQLLHQLYSLEDEKHTYLAFNNSLDFYTSPNKKEIASIEFMRLLYQIFHLGKKKSQDNDNLVIESTWFSGEKNNLKATASEMVLLSNINRILNELSEGNEVYNYNEAISQLLINSGYHSHNLFALAKILKNPVLKIQDDKKTTYSLREYQITGKLNPYFNDKVKKVESIPLPPTFTEVKDDVFDNEVTDELKTVLKNCKSIVFLASDVISFASFFKSKSFIKILKSVEQVVCVSPIKKDYVFSEIEKHILTGLDIIPDYTNLLLLGSGHIDRLIIDKGDLGSETKLIDHNIDLLFEDLSDENMQSHLFLKKIYQASGVDSNYIKVDKIKNRLIISSSTNITANESSDGSNFEDSPSLSKDIDKHDKVIGNILNKKQNDILFKDTIQGFLLELVSFHLHKGDREGIDLIIEKIFEHLDEVNDEIIFKKFFSDICTMLFDHKLFLHNTGIIILFFELVQRYDKESISLFIDFFNKRFTSLSVFLQQQYYYVLVFSQLSVFNLLFHKKLLSILLDISFGIENLFSHLIQKDIANAFANLLSFLDISLSKYVLNFYFTSFLNNNITKAQLSYYLFKHSPLFVGLVLIEKFSFSFAEKVQAIVKNAPISWVHLLDEIINAWAKYDLTRILQLCGEFSDNAIKKLREDKFIIDLNKIGSISINKFAEIMNSDFSKIEKMAIKLIMENKIDAKIESIDDEIRITVNEEKDK